MAKPADPFFVGWGKIPKGLRPFLIACSVFILVFFATVSYVISSTQTDTQGGAFMGPATAIGILRADPYPVLHVIESNRYARGETILLTGGGKRGVIKRAKDLDGRTVRIAGTTLQRGDLNGLQLRNGQNGLRADDSETDGFAVRTTQLGRWKLTGEICDGKCLNGAMRPGRGLAHKACANLCLLGDVPPVFVSSGAVEGSQFLLMANAKGGPVTQDILNFTATYVEIEGVVERHGDLLVFNIDPKTIRHAP
ncbi:MAG: hypothetical protein WBC93_08385 [Sulfitobacter sp.]